MTAAALRQEWHPEYPVDALTEHPENPRRGDASVIAESIDANGFYGAVLVQSSTGHVIAGNSRLRAARERGLPTIPALMLDVDDDRARRILLVDNRAPEAGTYDGAALASVLEDLETRSASLAGTGYDRSDLEALLDDLEAGRPGPFRAVATDVDTLRPHPRNYRAHPPEQLDHIAASLAEHGFYRNVVVARDGTILAGHGVVEAVRRAGRKRVPVIRLDLDPQDPRAMRVLTSDNEISNLAAVDDRALTDLLRELAQEGVHGLAGTGFDAAQVAALAMVTRPASEIADMEEAGEWIGLPGFEPTDRPPQLNIECATEADRVKLLEMIGVETIIKRMGSIWKVRYPDEVRRDLRSLRFEVPPDEEYAEADA